MNCDEFAFSEPLVTKYEEQLTSQSKVKIQMVAGIKRDYSSVEDLQAVNARFKQILLEVFPGCDQALQEEDVWIC